MDYLPEQIERKLKDLAGLVNDHSIHKAGKVEFRGYNDERGGYDFTITYNNDIGGNRDLFVFLKSLKEGGLITESLDPIPKNQNKYYKPINDNVQVDIEFGRASIIFHCDDYNQNSIVSSALDKAIAIKKEEAKHTEIPIKDKAEDRTIEISTQPIPRHPAADDVSNYLAHKVKNSMHQSGVKVTYGNSKPGSDNYTFIVGIKNITAENSQILANIIEELNKKSPEQVTPILDNKQITGFQLEGNPGFIKFCIEKHEKFPPIEKPDTEIENRLKALVSSINYAKAEGTGNLSYQSGDFIIAFPKSNAGFNNLKKLLGHIGIKHNLNDGILNKAPEDGHYIPTASTEFNIERKDTINIIFTPSKVVDNISLLDKAIESAKKDEEKIFLKTDPEKARENNIRKIQQPNINYVIDYLCKKAKAVTNIAEQNISVTYKPGNEEEKPSFIIAIPDNKLTSENSEKLLKELNKVLPVKATLSKDKDTGHDIITINDTPTAIAGYIKRDKTIDKTHTAHTR